MNTPRISADGSIGFRNPNIALHGNLLRQSARFVRCGILSIAVTMPFSFPLLAPSDACAQVVERTTLSKETQRKLKRRGSLELRDATLAEALYIVSKNWGVNIVVGNDVKGSINGTFMEAPLDEILTSMLHSRGYGYKAIGDSLVIMKLEDIGGVKDGFRIEQIKLKEVPPDEVADLIEILLSPNGRAHGVESAKSIVVIDYPDRITKIRSQLEELDRAAVKRKEAEEEAERAANGEGESEGEQTSGWLEQALQSIANANANQGANSFSTPGDNNTNLPSDSSTLPNGLTDPTNPNDGQVNSQSPGLPNNARSNPEDAFATQGSGSSGTPGQSTDPLDSTQGSSGDNAPNVQTTQGDGPGTSPSQSGSTGSEEIDNLLQDLQNNQGSLQQSDSLGSQFGGGQSGAGLSAITPTITNSDLSMAVFRPQYVNAAEIVDAIAIFVSEIGQVSVVDTENRLVAVDLPRNIAMMRRAVEMLDVPRSQVRISSLIFDASLEDLYRVGVNWASAANGRNLGVLDGNTIAQDSFQINSITAPNPAAGTANGAMTFMSLSRNFDVTAIVNALTTSNRSKLVASPSIVVKDRESGRFAIVTEIPYQELTEGLEGGSIGTTAFREAGVTLEVTPAIANDGTIDMIITPVFSVLSGFTPGDNQPIIDRREATTTVRIANGQTFVLAGLRQRSRVNERAGIPYLRDIRFIGDLFKHKNNEIEDNELIVFVTPEIVGTDTLGSAREFRTHQDGTYELENIPESTNAARCNPEDPTLQNNLHWGSGRVNMNHPNNAPTVQQFRYNVQQDEDGNYEAPDGATRSQDATERDRSARLRRMPKPPSQQQAHQVAGTTRRGYTHQSFHLSRQTGTPPRSANVVRRAAPLSMVPFKPSDQARYRTQPTDVTSHRRTSVNPDGSEQRQAPRQIDKRQRANIVHLTSEPTLRVAPQPPEHPRSSRRGSEQRTSQNRLQQFIK